MVFQACIPMKWLSMCFIFLEGALTIIVGDEKYTATQGEALYVPCGIPHGSENAFDGTTKYIALTIPPT